MTRITQEEVREQLAAILQSADFQASQRLKDFLAYIVEATLNGKSERLKAYSIAVDVFDLGENFDPRINPLVRTEAGRLRSKLDHYYLLNPASKIHISMPKGGYTAVFSPIEEPNTRPGPAGHLNEAYSFAPQKVAQPEHKAALLVMPFDNINSSVEARQFSAGLVNEITLGLTKFQELKVIDYTHASRLAAIIQRGKGKPVESQARFALGGGVQMDGSALKVWGFLVDAKTSYTIWSEKFDLKLDSATSLSALQESIAEAIVRRIADDFGLLHRTLLKEFETGVSSSSSIQEAALLYHHWTTVLTKHDFAKALHSMEKARNGAPEHAPTQAMLADLYASDYQWSYGLVENPLEKSLQLAIKAMNIDPECQVAHLAMAFNHYLRRDKEKFLSSAEYTLKINPFSTNALSALAAWYGISGLWDVAFNLLEKLISLSPTCPGWCHATIAMHHYMQGDYNACLSKVRKINMPETMWPPLLRLISGAFLDEERECAQAMANLISLYPDFNKNAETILSRNMPNEDSLAQIRKGLARAGFSFPQ